jgi:hypothetical protein
MAVESGVLLHKEDVSFASRSGTGSARPGLRCGRRVRELVQTVRGAAPVACTTLIPTMPLAPARRGDFLPSSRRIALGRSRLAAAAAVSGLAHALIAIL